MSTINSPVLRALAANLIAPSRNLIAHKSNLIAHKSNLIALGTALPSR